jgi:2-dehydro-3-deoxygalactonokinase
MPAIYVDMGTTNTRVWLVDGGRIVARNHRRAGVRDSARDGTRARLYSALRELIDDMRSQANEVSTLPKPQCVVAAGMSSSRLGLAEVPHVFAPAGSRELAQASQWIELPRVTGLPILLIPGVRSGPAGRGGWRKLPTCANNGLDAIGETDVMRGEETLCIGLVSLGLIEPPAVVLNLGSHWKAIQIDVQGRIASSITTLSGELIHAVQTQTILAGSVFGGRPDRINQQWMEQGMLEQRRSGLPRALFCARLFELAGHGTPEDRLAFVIGAFIAADIDLFVRRGLLCHDTRLLVSGSTALAHAWATALTPISILANVLLPDQVDNAFVAGLTAIMQQSTPD